jgi:thiol-disulfide isomerase/thioredoxin
MIEKRTEEDLASLKNETQQDLQFIKDEAKQDFTVLSSYIKFLDNYLKNNQLEQQYLATLTQEQKCNFTSIRMEEINEQFKYYWDRLPFRMEEFEKENVLSEEYILLKQQYTQLTLRTWLIAKARNEECNDDQKLVLYFYTTECDTCVKQGEILDELKESVIADGDNIMIFTFDLDSDSSIIKFLKKDMNIESVPAIMIDELIYQGRVFSLDELEAVI